MTERLADELTAKLNGLIGRQLPSGLSLAGWRFDMHRIAQTEIGLKNSRLGGPYTAPSFKEELGGEIFLHWNDAKYSSGRLDRLVLEQFDENWAMWQRTAFRDETGPDLVQPFLPPEVPLMDTGVEQVIAGSHPLPFDLLTESLAVLKDKYAVQKVNGRFKASIDLRTIRNSLGVDIQYQQSPVEIFIEADDLFGDSFVEKRLPSLEEVDHMRTYVGETLGLLRKESALPREGRMPILLPPAVMDAFADHYLTANLQGSLVANRQSAFRVEDFQSNKQVLRNDISIAIDGTRPLRSSSYRCTGEGVPSGKINLVKEGRLQTPILSLKYAKRLGMTATPIPVGGGLLIKAPMMDSIADLYRKAGDCLIIHSILGLHTQDYSSGDFSLTADQCLWMEGGEARGKVKAVISGNFLRALVDPATLFAYSPWDDNPACLFMADVTR